MNTYGERQRQFSQMPFAAGSMFGHRAFAIRDDGKLTGPSFTTVFGPGVNHAQCLLLEARMHPSVLSMTYLLAPIESVPVVNENTLHNPDHYVAKISCGCGFYAYYKDFGETIYEGLDRITGVIEGYGKVAVGGRGFKCSKARLVAVVKPKSIRRRWVMMMKRYPIIPIALVYLFVRGAWELVHSNWVGLLATFLACVIALVATFVAEKWMQRRKGRQAIQFGVTPKQWARFLKQYPGVKVYSSRKEMLAAHPLSEPDEMERTPKRTTTWTAFNRMNMEVLRQKVAAAQRHRRKG